MLLVFILSFAAIATAWTVPPNTRDGFYEVWTTVHGEQYHKFLAPLANRTYVPTNSSVAPTVPQTSAKFRRELTGPNSIICWTALLDGKEIDEANKNLDAQCGAGGYTPSTENGRDKYAIVGNTVAFFCNMLNGGNNCYASERQNATERIVSECGPALAGEDYSPDREVVYGYLSKDALFCLRGTNGK